MEADEPSRPAQPVVEENFNIFDDEEEAPNSEDVSIISSMRTYLYIKWVKIDTVPIILSYR